MAGLIADGQGPKGESETVWLWPCNVYTWNCWQALQTQWRVGGMGQLIGLDYAGVRAWLQDAEPKRSQRQDIWAGVQACERAVLQVAAEKAAQQKPPGKT